MNEIYYDYVEYWKHEGKLSPIDSLSFRLTNEHKAQEEPLVNAVKSLNPKSILEIGAGWGRIVKLLRENKINSDYTALDLSYDRLKQIQDKSVLRTVSDFVTWQKPKDVKYNLILAIEVLMHIPPDLIDDFVAKMKLYSDTIVVLDYDPEQPRDIELADHNFLHDYNKLFPNAEIHQVNYVQKMRIWRN